nr:IS200/IS605 family transposase [Sporolactobacillus shoreae]
MANQTNSLAHTKWLCKYHIVFTPKYRRKIIYNQYRASIQEIIRHLCRYKGVEILEGHMMPDHIHLLLSIPPKMRTRRVENLARLASRLIGFLIKK